jgi:hypothetical protein
MLDVLFVSPKMSKAGFVCEVEGDSRRVFCALGKTLAQKEGDKIYKF